MESVNNDNLHVEAGNGVDSIGGTGIAASSAAGLGHVLFLITTTNFGGTESILLELVRRMRGRGLDLTVCSMCPPGQVGREIKSLGVPIYSLDMSPNATFPELAKGAYRLARSLDERKIDLVQSFLYRANVVGTFAVRLARRRPVFVSGQRSLPIGERGKTRAVRWTRRYSDLVVAVSDAVRAGILEGESLSPDHVVVIRNGVDMELFRPVDGAAIRREFGFSNDSFVVGSVGRLAPVKGIEHLIDAVGVLHDRGLHLEVMLVGDGPDRAALGERSRARGIADRVHFLGLRRDLPELYAAMDLFALPSVQEGSPNALMEAMACGRPAVASAVGGVPEIIEDSVSGVLLPPADVQAWASALERMHADSQLRSRLGHAARRRIASGYDIELTVSQHNDLYARMIAEHMNGSGAISHS